MAISTAKAQLSEHQARSLTEEVKEDAAALWGKLLTLYEGGAHTALGYSSWGEYCKDEFDMGKSHAYRLLDSARVVAALPEGQSPIGESVARELAPLLDHDEVGEVWAEVVELHGDSPTASETRAVVEEKRGKMDVHYSSATPEWSTPQDLYEELDREFGFTLDVCATDENTKCSAYYTKEQDGLKQPWMGTCWMNPPYGDEIKHWVEKAHNASQDGATVVCLLPARVDTRWFYEYCQHGEVRFIVGRLKFGGSKDSAPFPSAVVIFGGKTQGTWWWNRGTTA